MPNHVSQFDSVSASTPDFDVLFEKRSLTIVSLSPNRFGESRNNSADSGLPGRSKRCRPAPNPRISDPHGPNHELASRPGGHMNRPGGRARRAKSSHVRSGSASACASALFSGSPPCLLSASRCLLFFFVPPRPSPLQPVL